MRRDRFAIAALTGLTVALVGFAKDTELNYPKTRTVDVVDDYHGTRVADPYRWLEDDVRKSDDVSKLGRSRERA